MKDFHVLMPVDGLVKVTDRFDSLLQFLNSRRATIHLACRVNTPLTIFDDSEYLKVQQAQMRNMGMMLKHEMLDRIAQKMQAKFPELTFEYHVADKPLHDVVASLQEELDFQLLMIDQLQFIESSTERELGEFHHLLAATRIPVWCVGLDAKTSGDTVVAVDLPAHNLQHEQLNRMMVHTACQLAQDFDNAIRLTHCWQLSTTEFMRRWLKLTDIDIARFSRVEKQQRESHLREYIEHNHIDGTTFQINILDGEASQILADACSNQPTRLLIIGHNQNPYGSIGHTAIDLLLKSTCDTLVLPYASNTRADFLAFIEAISNYQIEKRQSLLPAHLSSHR